MYRIPTRATDARRSAIPYDWINRKKGRSKRKKETSRPKVGSVCPYGAR
jgi:hypothetical protein